MDLKATICSLLEKTYSLSSDNPKEAEAELESLQENESYFPIILEISSTSSDESLRMASILAAIRFIKTFDGNFEPLFIPISQLFDTCTSLWNLYMQLSYCYIVKRNTDGNAVHEYIIELFNTEAPIPSLIFLFSLSNVIRSESTLAENKLRFFMEQMYQYIDSLMDTYFDAANIDIIYLIESTLSNILYSQRNTCFIPQEILLKVYEYTKSIITITSTNLMYYDSLFAFEMEILFVCSCCENISSEEIYSFLVENVLENEERKSKGVYCATFQIVNEMLKKEFFIGEIFDNFFANYFIPFIANYIEKIDIESCTDEDPMYGSSLLYDSYESSCETSCWVQPLQAAKYLCEDAIASTSDELVNSFIGRMIESLTSEPTEENNKLIIIVLWFLGLSTHSGNDHDFFDSIVYPLLQSDNESCVIGALIALYYSCENQTRTYDPGTIEIILNFIMDTDNQHVRSTASFVGPSFFSRFNEETMKEVSEQIDTSQHIASQIEHFIAIPNERNLAACKTLIELFPSSIQENYQEYIEFAWNILSQAITEEQTVFFAIAPSSMIVFILNNIKENEEVYVAVSSELIDNCVAIIDLLPNSTLIDNLIPIVARISLSSNEALLEKTIPCGQKLFEVAFNEEYSELSIGDIQDAILNLLYGCRSHIESVECILEQTQEIIRTFMTEGCDDYFVPAYLTEIISGFLLSNFSFTIERVDLLTIISWIIENGFIDDCFLLTCIIIMTRSDDGSNILESLGEMRKEIIDSWIRNAYFIPFLQSLTLGKEFLTEDEASEAIEVANEMIENTCNSVDFEEDDEMIQTKNWPWFIQSQEEAIAKYKVIVLNTT